MTRAQGRSAGVALGVFCLALLGATLKPGGLRAQGGPALGLTELGGISVNLLLLVLAPVAGGWWRADLGVPTRRLHWMFLATFVWALANYSEAFSYLVLNTLWLKSDMSTVVAESGVSRWIWFAAGCVLGALLVRWLRKPARNAAISLARPGSQARPWLAARLRHLCRVFKCRDGDRQGDLEMTSGSLPACLAMVAMLGGAGCRRAESALPQNVQIATADVDSFEPSSTRPRTNPVHSSFSRLVVRRAPLRRAPFSGCSRSCPSRRSSLWSGNRCRSIQGPRPILVRLRCCAIRG